MIIKLLRTNILNAGCTFLIGVILARALSPEDRGELANILLWPTFLSGFGLVGLPTYLARETAINPRNAKKNYRIGLIALFIICLVTLIIYYWIIIMNKANGKININFSMYIISGLIIPFSIWNAFQLQMELGRRNLSIFNYGRSSFSFSHFAFVIVLWMQSSESLIDYIIAFIGATIFAAISTNYFVVKKLKEESFIKLVHLNDVVQVMRSSWKFSISSSLIAIISIVDKVAVSVFLNAESMGLYTVAISVSQVSSIINEALSPLFFSKFAQKESVGMIDTIWLGMRLRQIVLINILIGLALVFLAKFMVPIIYGLDYQNAIGVVMLLIPAMCLRTMMRPYEEILKGSGSPLNQSYAMVSMTLVFASCASIAVYFQSLIGIAIAVLLSSFSGVLVVLQSVAKKTKVSSRSLIIPTYKDAKDLFYEIFNALKKLK